MRLWQTLHWSRARMVWHLPLLRLLEWLAPLCFEFPLIMTSDQSTQVWNPWFKPLETLYELFILCLYGLILEFCLKKWPRIPNLVSQFEILTLTVTPWPLPRPYFSLNFLPRPFFDPHKIPLTSNKNGLYFKSYYLYYIHLYILAYSFFYSLFILHIKHITLIFKLLQVFIVSLL